MLLLLLRKARRRRSEAPPGGGGGSEAVPHGRLLLEWSSSGSRSGSGSGSGGGAELIRVRVGGGLLLLLSAHFDTAVRRAPRRRSGSQGRYHPPVELGVEHGQRREDARLDPREGDDGPSRAGLGEAVVVVIFSFVFFVFRKLKKSESFSLLVLLCQGREISFRFVAPPPCSIRENSHDVSLKNKYKRRGKKKLGRKKEEKKLTRLATPATRRTKTRRPQRSTTPPAPRSSPPRARAPPSPRSTARATRRRR